MTVSCFTKTTNQHIVSGIQIDNARAYTNRRSPHAHEFNRLARIAISRIKHQTDPRKSLRISSNLLNKCWEQFVRKIVNGAKANIFQRLGRRCLPRARQPGQQDHTTVGSHRPTARGV